MGKPDGMGPFWSSRWEDNIKVGIRGTGYEGVDWIQLGHYSVQWWILMNMAMHLGFLRSRIFHNKLSDYGIFEDLLAPCRYSYDSVLT